MHVLSVFSWNAVRAALNDIERCRSYYLGGTLCIDMAQGYTVCLNRSGRGFTYLRGRGSETVLGVLVKETKFLMPKDCEEKVNKIYNKFKKNGN